MQESMNIFVKPRCEKCGSNFCYTRIDGAVVCRRCGYITKPKEMKSG